MKGTVLWLVLFVSETTNRKKEDHIVIYGETIYALILAQEGDTVFAFDVYILSDVAPFPSLFILFVLALKIIRKIEKQDYEVDGQSINVALSVNPDDESGRPISQRSNASRIQSARMSRAYDQKPVENE